MIRLKVTCPNSGHLEEIEYFENAAEGRILGVARCSAFDPEDDVKCDLTCAQRLNHRFEASNAGPPTPPHRGRGEAGANGTSTTEPAADDGRLPRVSEVMTSELLAVGPETSIATAARIMLGRRISGLPVVRGETPVGVVSLSDLVDPDGSRSSDGGFPIFYRLGDGRPQQLRAPEPFGSGTVEDVMSPFVLSIEGSASVVDASRRMLAESVHRLLVREGTRLVGIVTMTDLLRAFSRLFDS